MRILVPRIVDEAQTSAQSLNAKALLARFESGEDRWMAVHYDAPDAAVSANPAVELAQLWHGRPWPWHMAALYQRPAEAIFYPGIEWHDSLALGLRRRTGRRVPIIATLEGLAGDEARERELSNLVGHPVHCHLVDRRRMRRVDRVLRQADHIIAVSPFLGRVARRLYRAEVSVLPIGYDDGVFHARGRTPSPRPRVVCAAGVRRHKRPGVYLDLARRYPEADFVWYGEGELRRPLADEAARRGLRNLSFAGPLAPSALAEAFRKAEILVLPSLSEGVPRITHEAAASGLAQVIFGFYEAPTVADGINGTVVWSDEELERRLGELLADRERTRAMGMAGVEMARAWTWSRLAPLWQEAITSSVKHRLAANSSAHLA